MKDSLVAKRYARAFRGVLSDEELQTRADELTAIAELFNNPSVTRILSSPVVGSQVKNAALENACDQLNADAKTRVFMRTIVDAGRVKVIPSIAKALREIADEQRNLLRAKIITAVKIDNNAADDVKKMLKNKLGKEVSIETAVDESILGGLVVELGNRKIDLSLKTRLDHLAQSALS